VNLKLIVHEILEDYALPIHGDHGVSHWARVLENGLRLSKATEANVTVVSLFAVFHDSNIFGAIHLSAGLFQSQLADVFPSMA